MISTNRIMRSCVLLLALLAGSSSTLRAHGGGVLKVASKQVPAGGTIAMSGEKLGNNTSLRIELRGVLDNYALGSVRTAADATLSDSLAVPPSVPARTYTLVALAPDGDIVGRTEVTVGPAERGNAAMHGMAGMSADAMAGMEEMKATGDMMKIDANTRPGEWAVIAALIFGSFAAGAALLARSRRASES